MNQLNIVCALYCEAKPLIEALKLKKNISISRFQSYKNHDDSINLILSGVGKINSAVVTSFLAAKNESRLQSFLNVGIAGSLNIKIGEIRAVNKIQDVKTKKSFFPQSQLLKKIQATNLFTVDFPNNEIPKDAMVDMEGMGFYQAAIKYTTQEFIQVLKIISDNVKEDLVKITEKVAERLLADQIETILNATEQMQQLLVKQCIKEDNNFQKIIAIIHFTEQEKIQLKRYLERAEIFSIDIESMVHSTYSSRKILKDLRGALERYY